MSRISDIAKMMKGWWSNEGSDVEVQEALDEIIKLDSKMNDLTSKAVGIGYLYDWYQSSVGLEEPIWTDEHIEELYNDFYLIPKQEKDIKGLQEEAKEKLETLIQEFAKELTEEDIIQAEENADKKLDLCGFYHVVNELNK